LPWYAFDLSPLRLCSAGAGSFRSSEQPRDFIWFSNFLCPCLVLAIGGRVAVPRHLKFIVHAKEIGKGRGSIFLAAVVPLSYAGKVCLVSDLACRLLVLSVSSLTILLRSWSLRSAASYLHQLLFACRMSLALLPLAAYCSSPSTCCLRL
jgi:hypothetical protein